MSKRRRKTHHGITRRGRTWGNWLWAKDRLVRIGDPHITFVPTRGETVVKILDGREL